MQKISWPLTNRVLHTVLIVAVAVSFASSASEAFLFWHILFGIAVFWTVFARFAWGFIGPQYSKFRDFDLSVKNLIMYFKNILKPHESLGHNPASSWSAIGMLFALAATCVTGFAGYLLKSHDLKEVHEFFAYLSLAIIAGHIAGAVLSAFTSGKDTLFRIFVKTKGSSIPSFGAGSKAAGIALAFGVLPVFGAAYYAMTAYLESKSAALAQQLPPVYAKECAECHSLYPASYIGKAGWERIMGNLSEHFGTDASLDEEATAKITEFLKQNGGSDGTKFSALASAEDKIEITKTKVWIKKHKKIPKEIFAKKESRASNCLACHKDANSGAIDPANISFEKLSSKDKMSMYGALLCE